MNYDERHDAVTAVFSNIRSLRAYARDVSLEFLQEVLGKLASIISEKEVEQRQAEQMREQKKANLEKVKKYMTELGLDPEMLASTIDMESRPRSNPEKNLRSVVMPKYRITDQENKVIEWSGRGKPPKAFKKAFDEGHSKEKFLIHGGVSS
ncbi:H-NS histone family protein [Salmonella enterica]|nr:H-NS histone family protein [Salmonella enterica]